MNNNSYGRLKKYAICSLVVFLVIILLLTFFSKTIYYYSVTRVTTTSVRRGALEWKHQVSADVFHDKNVMISYFPLKINNQLLITDVFVEKNKEINAGEPVLAFDKYTYEQVCLDYELEIESLRNDLQNLGQSNSDSGKSEINIEYILSKDELQRKITELNSKIENNSIDYEYIEIIEEEITEIKVEITELESELTQQKLFLEEGMATLSEVKALEEKIQQKNDSINKKNQDITNYTNKGKQKLIDERNGYVKDLEKLEKRKSLEDKQKSSTNVKNDYTAQKDLLSKKLVRAEENYELFNKLIDDDAVIRAKENCVVGDVFFDKGDLFSGLTKVYEYTMPKERVLFVSELPKNIFSNISTNKNYIAKNDKYDFDLAIAEKKVSDGKYFIYFSVRQLNDDGKEYKMEESLDFELILKSDNYDILVPNNAIFEQQYIYVVEKTEGFFGEQRHLKKINVKVLATDSKYSAVSSDTQISYDALIVNGWNNTLYDGQPVISMEGVR